MLGSMESKHLTRVIAACIWVALAHACGPDELPAFANPPPDDSDDAGVNAADDDAGHAQPR